MKEHVKESNIFPDPTLTKYRIILQTSSNLKNVANIPKHLANTIKNRGRCQKTLHITTKMYTAMHKDCNYEQNKHRYGKTL
jgi:hypothetical protein